MQCFFGILLTAVLLVMTPGYGSAQPAATKAVSPATQPKGAAEKEAPAPPAKSYTLKERQAYQQKVAADLDKLRQRIDDLTVNYETIKPQVKRTTRRVYQGLKKQHFAAQNQLAALEKAPEEDWGRLKAEMDKTLKDLTKACQDAESLLQ